MEMADPKWRMIIPIYGVVYFFIFAFVDLVVFEIKKFKRIHWELNVFETADKKLIADI